MSRKLLHGIAVGSGASFPWWNNGRRRRSYRAGIIVIKDVSQNTTVIGNIATILGPAKPNAY